MADRIVALLALATLLLFVGVIITWVPETDLIVVCLICLAMACYDFYRMIILVPRRKAEEEAKSSS